MDRRAAMVGGEEHARGARFNVWPRKRHARAAIAIHTDIIALLHELHAPRRTHKDSKRSNVNHTKHATVLAEGKFGSARSPQIPIAVGE